MSVLGDVWKKERKKKKKKENEGGLARGNWWAGWCSDEVESLWEYWDERNVRWGNGACRESSYEDLRGKRESLQ